MSAVVMPDEDNYEDILCRHCNKPIFRDYNRWLHVGEAVEIPGLPFKVQSDYGMRGCRAASFSPGNGWDDSLDRKWNAAPAK